MPLRTPSEKPGAPRIHTWSLAARLTAWYAGATFLLILLATGFLYWALVSNLDREDDQLLSDKVHVLSILLQEQPDDFQSLKREMELESGAGRNVPVFLRVLDSAGRAVLETPGMSDHLPPSVFPTASANAGPPYPSMEIETATRQSFRVLTARVAEPRTSASGTSERTPLINVRGSDANYVLQVALDRTYEEDLLAGYRRDLGLVLIGALAACALAGHQIARRGMRPVRAISEAAGRIHPPALSERLPAHGWPRELATLAAQFNTMLDRLDESFSKLNRFAADIAHELRSPINNLRGEVEVALSKPRGEEEYRDTLGSALEECGRLARIIDSLLFLARSQGTQVCVVGEPVDLARELGAVREFYEAAATEAGISLSVTAAPGIIGQVDRTLFQRAVGNLVANALAHTPEGGTIHLTAKSAGDQAGIEVADTGCGIAADHLTRVFDPFYRVDPARTGAGTRVGLGLAIVKSIMILHGGTARITSELGKGTCVTLVFPGSSSPKKMTIL